MATMTRESATLPTVKCSVCSAEVEISLMSDHVCGGSNGPKKKSYLPLWRAAKRPAAASAASPTTAANPTTASTSRKPFMLPPIDAFVANSPFLTVEELTSSAGSGPSAHSPATPQGTPSLSLSSSSPASSSSPFQSTYGRSGTSSTYSTTSGGDGSGGGGPLSATGLPRRDLDSPTIPPSDYYANRTLPPSPPVAAGEKGKNLLARLNLIAPGPFGPRRGSNDRGAAAAGASPSPPPPSAAAAAAAPPPPPAAAAPPLPPAAAPPPPPPPAAAPPPPPTAAPPLPPAAVSPLPPAATAAGPSLRSSGGARFPQHGSSNPYSVEPPQQLPSLAENRSSPPSAQPPEKPKRRAPHPGVGLPRTPSQYRHKKDSSGPLTSAPVAPQKAGTGSGPTEKTLPPIDSSSAEHAHAPPPPSTTALALAQRFPPRKQQLLSSNAAREKPPESPPHPASPSESSSSTWSGSSSGSGSSLSSSSSAFSYASKSPPPSLSSPHASIASRTSEPQPADHKPLSRPDHARMPPAPRDSDNLIDSLMSQLQSASPAARRLPPSKDGPQTTAHTAAATAPRSPAPPAPQPPPPPPPPPLDGPDAPPQPSGRGHRRMPTTSKGPCRGCGEQIFGKSISSADGRLTGRYHKQCFSCQTCREHFQSAEFYVMNNLPYCERHYHELNNSLCAVCDRGIEGPCLEAVRQERFHPACFTCCQCPTVLGDDYFEINGRPFCEFHAHRYMQRQPPRPHPTNLGGGGGGGGGGGLRVPSGRPTATPKVERRRTRLMFMGADAPMVPGIGSRY